VAATTDSTNNGEIHAGIFIAAAFGSSYSARAAAKSNNK
jgi:hypothetical protein